MTKGRQKFHFSFERAGLTSFGGLSLLQSFCKSELQGNLKFCEPPHERTTPSRLFQRLGLLCGVESLDRKRLGYAVVPRIYRPFEEKWSKLDTSFHRGKAYEFTYTPFQPQAFA